jgi:flagellar biosynthesis/type III secretory pathway M-ring protein FliF/YscJ
MSSSPTSLPPLPTLATSKETTTTQIMSTKRSTTLTSLLQFTTRINASKEVKSNAEKSAASKNENYNSWIIGFGVILLILIAIIVVSVVCFRRRSRKAHKKVSRSMDSNNQSLNASMDSEKASSSHHSAPSSSSNRTEGYFQMNQSLEAEKQRMLGDLQGSQVLDAIDKTDGNAVADDLTLRDLQRNSQKYCRRFSEQADAIDFGEQTPLQVDL